MNLEYPKNEIQHLKELIFAADREGAVAFLEKRSRQTSYQDVILSLFEPVLKNIGELWLKEKLSLAQGYVAGKIAEDIFHKAIKNSKFHREIENSKGPVIIGNIEDDYHELGKKMVSTFLRLSGWEVHDLGPDITAEEFVAEAIKKEARIIAVSAMMYSTAENIKKVRYEIDNNGLNKKVRLAVGGAVFNIRPELVYEVGGDGTSESAITTPQLFDKLYDSFDCGGSL